MNNTPMTAIPAGNYNFDNPDTIAAGAMSRSSSGPGIAVDGGIVQFGEHRPVIIEEARRRVEHRSQEEGRRRSAQEEAVGLGVDMSGV